MSNNTQNNKLNLIIIVYKLSHTLSYVIFAEIIFIRIDKKNSTNFKGLTNKAIV